MNTHCSLCMWRSVEEELRIEQCICCGHKYPLVINYKPNNSAEYKCVMCQESFVKENDSTAMQNS